MARAASSGWRYTRLAAGAAILLPLLVACSSSPAPKAAESKAAQHAATSSQENTKVVTVMIRQFKYQPDPIIVNQGDIVEWKNEDIIPHTVTAADGKAFDSGRIVKGASWHFTASTKGTFNYFCTYHPNMKGRLIVQ